MKIQNRVHAAVSLLLSPLEPKQGLLLGFACASPSEIESKTKKLVEICKEAATS